MSELPRIPTIDYSLDWQHIPQKNDRLGYRQVVVRLSNGRVFRLVVDAAGDMPLDKWSERVSALFTPDEYQFVAELERMGFSEYTWWSDCYDNV